MHLFPVVEFHVVLSFGYLVCGHFISTETCHQPSSHYNQFTKLLQCLSFKKEQHFMSELSGGKVTILAILPSPLDNVVD